MKIRKQLRTFSFLFLILIGWSQTQVNASSSTQIDTVHFQLKNQLQVQSKLLQTDQLGNIYVVDASERLLKYNASGLLLSTLNYTYSGSISSVDVSNPMEIFLFYRELNTIILLDNNLAFRGKINLQDWGIVQASCIARSYENGIWVFDAGDLQLKKFTRDGKLLQSSGNVLEFAGNDKINPLICIDNGNRVIISDTSNGIFLFDVFAGFIKKIPVSGLKSVQLLDGEIVFFKEKELVSIQLNNVSRKLKFVPQSGIQAVYKMADSTYILKTENAILITNMAK